jgi:hypothetical protein
MDILQERFTEYMDRKGETVLVDGTSRTVFFMAFREGVTTHNDYMYLFAQAGEVSSGALIEKDGKLFLVTHKESNINGTYDKFLIRNITKNINLVLNDTLVSVPSIIFDGVQRIDDNKYLSVAEGKLQLLIPYNDTNKVVAENDKFISFNQAWEIIGFTFVEDGLITLYCEKVLLSDNDDIINEIPDTYTPPAPEPTGTYYIDGADSIKTVQTITYTGVKKEDDVIVPSVWAFTLEDNGYEVVLTILGDDSCTIWSDEGSGNITLTGVCDGETITKEIELKGLW